MVSKYTGGKIPAIKSVNHPLHGYRFVETGPEAQNDLSQKEAKRYMPPDSYLWRANKKGCWCARVLPHRSRSESWSKHDGDSTAAMLCVARNSWETWLADRGLPTSHCPIKGIF